MKTEHWHRDVGWPCPYCTQSFHSPEMLGLHVAGHEVQYQLVADHRTATLSQQIPLDLESSRQ